MNTRTPSIKDTLISSIHMHGPDCVVMMGGDDFSDLSEEADLASFDRPSAATGQIIVAGVRIMTNAQPGTRGFIIGSVADMGAWMRAYTGHS